MKKLFFILLIIFIVSIHKTEEEKEPERERPYQDIRENVREV